MAVVEGRSLPRKSETSVKIGKIIETGVVAGSPGVRREGLEVPFNVNTLRRLARRVRRRPRLDAALIPTRIEQFNHYRRQELTRLGGKDIYG